VLINVVHGTTRPMYHQFYVFRGGDPDLVMDLSQELEGYHVAGRDGGAVVSTYRYGGEGPVLVEVHDAEPVELPGWQRIVRCPLGGDEGDLAVNSWAGSSAFSVPLPHRGPLMMRVMWQGLHTSDWDQMPDPVAELIGIQIWPAPFEPRRIERAWEPWDPPPAGWPASVHRLDESPSWLVLPLWFARGDAPPMPGADGVVYSVIYDRETDGFVADGVVEGRERVCPLSDDEARVIAAQSGPWRLHRRADGTLCSLSPELYAAEALLNNYPDIETRLLALGDPGLLAGEMDFLQTVIDPAVLVALGRLGVEPLIVDV
jgi:hypothetical protein